MKVKICGIHSSNDLNEVVKFKPDFVGMVVDYPKSPRSVSIEEAKERIVDLDIPAVILLVNQRIENAIKILQDVKPDVVQFHGDESSEYISELKKTLSDITIWKAIHLPLEHEKVDDIQDYLKKISDFEVAGCDAFVLDSRVKGIAGGTGVSCDWALAAKLVENIKSPIFLAGGLDLENIKTAVTQVKPFGVDVSSGVESSPAKKDLSIVEAFIEGARKS